MEYETRIKEETCRGITKFYAQYRVATSANLGLVDIPWITCSGWGNIEDAQLDIDDIIRNNSQDCYHSYP